MKTCEREDAELYVLDTYPAHYTARCPGCSQSGGGETAQAARAAIVCGREHQPKDTPDAP